MAVDIVDEFEVVDVHERQREGLALVLGEGLGNGVIHTATVEQTGQNIVRTLALELDQHSVAADARTHER